MLQPVENSVLRSSVAGATELVAAYGGFSPRRLPESALRARADDNIQVYSGVATGIRLRLSTAAEHLEVSLRAVIPVALPDSQTAAPVLVAEVGAELVATAIEPFARQWVSVERRAHREDAPAAVVRLALPPAATERDVTLWLPINAEVTVLGMRADAPVRAAEASSRPRWLHHGSSISHALELPSPFGPWPQRVARERGLELTNLSMAGQAVLDPFVARTIAAHPVDLITLKFGINIVNSDGFSTRTLGPALHGFLDIIRAGQPTVPLVVITAVVCPIHEETPGPTIAGPDGRAMAMPRQRHPRDGRLTLSDTRHLISRVVSERMQDDPRVSLVDGTTLLGAEDAHTLHDNLHPDAQGNDLIAARFLALPLPLVNPLR